MDKSGFISVEANAYLNSVISRVSNMSVDTESSLGDDLKNLLRKLNSRYYHRKYRRESALG